VAVRNEPPSYRVYLLRSWEVRSADSDGPVTWRFSLEDPQTGEKRGFGDLESLVAFLRARTAGLPVTDGADSEKGGEA
jgi:hypothetical protein